MNLYPHNQRTYEAVIEHFKTHNTACIVHATGTGKAYISAAVAEHYNNVLVIAQADFILNETRSLIGEKATYLTYQYLSKNIDNLPSGYDLIVFDEFHRAGATQWGAAVDRLIEVNPTAKLFGTTATEVRYLDDNRNMADELFEGNVVSRLDLAEAWAKGILTPPLYITGLFSFSKINAEFEERINDTYRLTDERKAELISYMDGMRLDWAKSIGVESIFHKHLNKSIKRIVVFCDHIENIKDMQKQVLRWLKNAGQKIAKVYSVSTANPRSEKDMEKFSLDDTEGLKVMFAVNMLNEGVHVKNVNAVVMLRSTTSRIIHLQQMGRCMNASDKVRPIIFDLVDNLEKSDIYAIQKDYIAQRDILNRRGEYDLSPSKEIEMFEIEDNVKPIRDVINSLYKQYHLSAWTPEEWYAEIRKWCTENKRLPNGLRPVKGKAYPQERIMESRMAQYIYRNSEVEQIKEIIKEFSVFNQLSEEEKLQVVLEFIEKNDRLPITKRNISLSSLDEDTYWEHQYGMWLHRNKGKIEVLDEQIKKYSGIKFLSFDEKFAILEKWCKDNGRLPLQTRKKCLERTLRTFLNNWIENEQIKALVARYGGIMSTEESTLQKITMLYEYCTKNNARPTKEDNPELYGLFENFVCKIKHNLKWRDNPMIVEMRERFLKMQRGLDEAKIVECEEFCKKHNRLPDCNIKEERKLQSRIRKYRNTEPRLQYLYETYLRQKPCEARDIRIEQLKAFVAEHGYLPRNCGSKSEEGQLAAYWARFKDTVEEGRVIYASYPTYRDYCDIQVVRAKIAWVEEHGRLPHKGKGEYEVWRYFSRNKNRAEIKAVIDKYGKLDE